MDASKTPFDDPDFLSKSESATGEPSSATGIFGTIPAQPSKPQEDDLLKSLLRGESAPTQASPAVPQTKAGAPVEPPAIPPTIPADPTPSASPGGFTQMFQALKTPEASPATAPVAPLASNAPPKSAPDLANVFTKVLVEKPSLPDLPPGPRASPKAGEFTQMLRSLSNPVEQTGKELSPPAMPGTAQAAPPPGSFTQVFKAISPEPAERQEATNPEATRELSVAPPPAKPEPASAPGDFTRMFQAAAGPVSSQPAPPAAPPQPPIDTGPGAGLGVGPGSFTQMFSQRTIEKAPQEDPLKSLHPEPVQKSDFQFSSAPARPFESSPPAQGGFTQLLQALNKEEPSPGKVVEPLISPPAPSPAAANPAAGGFTQLLQTLSAEPTQQPAAQQPFAPLPPVQPPIAQPQVFSAPPSTGGPGEFTRVISSSALRDVQGPASAPVPPVAAAPGNRPGLPPMQLPQAPVYPPAPPMPQMPHGGAATPPAVPQFQPAPFAFPPPPAPPPAPAPAPSKLQQYLPLILVLNVFVLLVIVLILIFVLRHK